MANVTLKNVSKIYKDGVRAVNNISLEIPDREFVVLVGPSGCGKSTTLRMVAGLEEITEGEIFIENVLVNHVPAKNRDIAMVFQNYALYPHMTVYVRKQQDHQLLRTLHKWSTRNNHYFLYSTNILQVLALQVKQYLKHHQYQRHSLSYPM